MSRVLIVDDEASICWAFREFLGELGHDVKTAPTAEEGLSLAEDHDLDAVVLDVRLPGMDGLSALARFRHLEPPAPVIVITAFGDLDTAVRAMEGGAFDYLVKPFDLDQAAAVVQRALDAGQHGLAEEEEEEAAPARLRRPAEPLLIGRSPLMQALFKDIALVAPSDVPVLITGESGVGKELVARAVHRHSGRCARSFLPVCLAALSASLIERELFGHTKGSFTGAVQDRKGLLELADGGTVLLDEIGDVPPSVQVKLLRAIEHKEVTPVGDARPRPVDVRFLAATNRPLEEMMASGQFREDLYFRLSVFPIRVPPLRDRREDIPVLAEHFVRQVSGSPSGPSPLRDDLLRELMARPWIGNVRELRNALERAAIVARGRELGPEHLAPRVGMMPAGPGNVSEELHQQIGRWTETELRRSPEPQGDSALYDRFLGLVEPPLLRTVLRDSQGNRAVAAQRIGIHRATLRQKMRRYGLE